MPPFTHPLQIAAAATVASLATYITTRQFSTEAQLGRLLMATTEFLKAEHQARNPTCFTIDRILDADCKGKKLVIGAHSCGDPNLPLSGQGIRHGDNEPIQRLLEFRKAPDGHRLDYLFENNTRLSINKAEKGEVRYTFETPQGGRAPPIFVAKAMDPLLVRNFKAISMNSAELDAIAQLR
jgi:hypothetical protein